MANTPFLRRISRPPVTGNRGLDRWLQDLADEVNQLPNFSTASTSGGPESTISAPVGTLFFEGNSSESQRLWMKDSGTSSIGWQHIPMTTEAPRAVIGYGSFYISSAAETTINSASSYEKVAGTTTEILTSSNFSHSTGRLTYKGSSDIHVHVAVTVDFTAATANKEFSFRIGKNDDITGTPEVGSQVNMQHGTAADKQSTALHYDANMVTDDYLELFIANETDTGNATIEHAYFFVLGMEQF